jgi:hypothetical protein
MKQVLIFFLVLTATAAAAQDSLSVARLKSLKGIVSPFSAIEKKDSLFLICFWSTSSEESINELNGINASLDQWKMSVPFRFLGINVDEGKAANKVRPTYNMNSWTFEVFTDLYGDLRRTLHSNNLPQSLIIFKHKIIYQQSGWSAGSENYLLQKLISVHAGRW